jgi:hypothetical protein
MTVSVVLSKRDAYSTFSVKTNDHIRIGIIRINLPLLIRELKAIS